MGALAHISATRSLILLAPKLPANPANSAILILHKPGQYQSQIVENSACKLDISDCRVSLPADPLMSENSRILSVVVLMLGLALVASARAGANAITPPERLDSVGLPALQHPVSSRSSAS